MEVKIPETFQWKLLSQRTSYFQNFHRSIFKISVLVWLWRLPNFEAFFEVDLPQKIESF